MITELRLRDWKSFKDTVVYIDPLTFLIGTNASGKSNILDAFDLLARLSKGSTLEDAVNQVRGGEEWIIRKGCQQAEIEVVMEVSSWKYTYHITISKDNIGLKLTSNDIYVCPQGKKEEYPEMVREQDVSTGMNVIIDKDSSYPGTEKDIPSVVLNQLKQIFILEPIPERMRGFSKLSKELKRDGSNIAGVIAALDNDQKTAIESALSTYVRPLPERDINRIEAVPVGLSMTDAMLYCYEDWNPNVPVDARGMSDGTLRFAAIVVALLTAKPHSLLLVEEVDNGLHPSRAKELVKMLREISQERHVDVLCTTHNPILINELGNEMIPFISYIKRDQEGCSYVELLEDKDNLAKLMANGTIGDMMTRNQL